MEIGGDIPVVGDWDADGRDDIGIFRKHAQRNKDKCAFYWDLNLTGESADFPPILLGNDKCIPITGDWNGNGFDTIGVFDPSKGKFYLDYNHDGIVEKTLVLRTPGKIPITGDWDGDGIDDIGVYQIDGKTNKFYLDLDLTGRQVEYTASIAYPKKNIDFFNIPIVGDWDGDKIDDIGIYRPSTG